MAYGRIRREEQRFFVQTREVLGIQSIRGSYSFNRVPLKHLGMHDVSGMVRGPQISQILIAGTVVTEDQFLAWTGNSGFNGYIVRSSTNTGENYSFTSGYLTNYNSRCSIGQIPQYSAEISVFGNIGRFLTSESTQVASNLADIVASATTPASLSIAGPGTIAINLDEFTSNRVLSYDLNLTIPRNASYCLGQRTPLDVQRIVPMEIDFRFTLDADTYVPRTMRNFPGTEVVQNLSLILRQYNSSYAIMSFSFNNMKLQEESYSSEINNNVNISLLYKGYAI